jgi:hypothetical protein
MVNVFRKKTGNISAVMDWSMTPDGKLRLRAPLALSTSTTIYFITPHSRLFEYDHERRYR